MTAPQTPSDSAQHLVTCDQLLTVRMTEYPGAVVVHVSGEIDLCTAPILRTCLTTQVINSNQPPVLVINLTDVSFISCAGLRVLFDTQHDAAAHGTILRLVDCSPAVLRLLGLPSIRHEFPLYSSLADALPWLPPETTSPS